MSGQAPAVRWAAWIEPKPSAPRRAPLQVFLGASAVMSNGTVMGRAGNAAVAMMAHAHSKPVIVCCESYKFHERVQLDAITSNELGDPDALSTVAGRPDVHALRGWQVRCGSG